MTDYIPETDGLHCIACDKSLDGSSGDSEMCSTCLNVVKELNHSLYFAEEDADDETRPA